MSATYDPALATDLDWVRFLMGDVDITRPAMDDLELQALLVQQGKVVGSGPWTPYYAAAQALDTLTARWHTATGGLTGEHVGSLSLSYAGTSGSTTTDRSKLLREQGAELKLPRPRIFECL